MFRSIARLAAAWIFICVSQSNLTAQCALSCHNLLQVSLNQNGQATILPQTILTNAYPLSCSPTGPNAFTVTIMGANGQPIPTNPTVTCANVGQTLTVKVTHNASQNSCWGSIKIEDKLPPALVCTNKTVSCAVSNLEPSNPLIGQPTATDNCDASLTLSKVDVFTDLNCNQTYNGTYYSGYVTRTWTAVDDYANSTTCTQLIFLERKTVWQVNFPKNLDGNVLPALQCSPAPNTNPSATGFPTIDNVPIQTGSFCELNAAYTDQTVPICDGTYKILRTWTVVDWCNNMTKSSLQIIKVVDDKPPVFACPADMTASTSGSSCSAAVNFPAVSATDNCSASISYKITTPFGTVNSNGGSLTGIPAGTHTIIYMATDACGNSSTCSLKLTVGDDDPPVAICDGYTVVSIGSSGSVTVPAGTLDDGSYDNCCAKPTLIFKVKKMGDPGDFQPSVTFTCADVGVKTVILRVIDCNGNYNDCMVSVEVQDKLDPVLTCPPNKTIQCKGYTSGGNFNQLYGAPTATDNCGTPTVVELTPIIDLGMCGTGTITRIFKATDGGGRTALCTQIITIINSTPYNGSQIQWPPDYSITACSSPDSLAPTKLPAPYNAPNLGQVNYSCSQVGVNHTDEVFQIAPPACWKILRKWVVIDWCQFNPNIPNSPGRWEYTQTLKIMDTTPPVFTNPPDNMTVELGANCVATVTLPQPTATDCSTDITFVANSPFGSGFGPFQNISAGDYDVTFRAFDGCGNQAVHTFKVFVKDLKAPTPVCLNGLSINLMQSGMAVIWASDFSAGSSNDNCTPAGLLKYSLAPFTGITSDTFTCADLGTNVINLYVSDASGNQSFCTTYIIVQDNFGICPNQVQTAQVAGFIKNEQNETVEDVKITLTGGSNAIPVITGSDGSFAFPGVPVNGNYTVEPKKDLNPLNGISTFDLVKLGKHILNTEKLTSPYKIIAADINHNGTVSTFDMVELRKLILGIYSDFPAADSWRFVDAGFQFSDPADPFKDNFPEKKSVNGLPTSGMNGNFIGVKVGDLTGDAVPNNFIQSDDRTAGTLDLFLENKKCTVGEKLELTLRARDFSGIEALQTTLGWDVDALGLEKIVPKNGMPESNFNMMLTGEGLLPMVWENASENTQSADNEFVTLNFICKKSGSTPDFFRLPEGYTPPAAWRNGEHLNLQLVFENGEGQNTNAPTQSLELQQNQPNPWQSETTVGYVLPTYGERAVMRVFDVAGRQVAAYVLPVSAGYGEVKISRSDLPTAGVFQIRLETSSGVLTRKMVVVD